MKFSAENNRAVSWLYHKRMYFLAFFIPALIMFGVYAAFGVYPFGDNSVLVLDLNGQYVYYFEAMRDAFWGNGSMLYSWSRNLGGEMMGIYGYYLASPFSLIVMLFPRSMITESLLIMQLAKIGACGVTFTYYLKKSKRIDGYSALIFSSLYALMAYAVVQLMDPMWIDGLVYLPLIIFGLERLIEDKKLLRFIIPLALMFIANFYIGYMIGFFCAIYFFCYLFFIKKDDDNSGSIKSIIMVCLRFALAAIAAVLCAAVVLLPVYYSLKLGKLEFTNPDFSLKPQFSILDFFSKFMPQSYDTVRNEGLPFVYCGTLSFLMIPLYFMNSNIEARKKIGNGFVLILVFISMYLSTIDMAWHGFQVPNWLPYRYSFTFSFIILIMAAEAFERIEGISFKQLGAVILAAVVYVIFADSKGYEYFSTTQGVWFTFICIFGYAMMLYYYKKNATSKTVPLIILVLVAGELFGNSLQTLKAINKDVVYSKHSSYVDYIKDGREITKQLEEYDGSFYRTEKTFHRTVNDALAFGTKGLSHSSSTLNAGVINFLDRLGFASRGHYVKYKGETFVTDALLGIKYVMNKDKPMYYDNEVLSYKDMKVYENPNALSVGYMVSENVRDLHIEKDNPFENQNKVLSSMLSQPYTEYFKQITIDDVQYENVDTTQSGDHTKYTAIVKGQNAQIEFLMNAPTDDIVYMYLPCTYSGYEKALNIWVNHEYLDQYYETENYSIKTLGRFAAGESLSVITTLTKDEATMRDQWFYYLDEDMFKTAIDTLKQGQLDVTDYSDTYIKGTVTAQSGQMLFTTIPYEPGWTVKVDGEKVKYEKIADGLMGIPMSEGTHTVTMSFFPEGMALGIILSSVGVLMVVIIAVFERKNRKILLNRLYK